jgi:hypothetical protein
VLFEIPKLPHFSSVAIRVSNNCSIEIHEEELELELLIVVGSRVIIQIYALM